MSKFENSKIKIEEENLILELRKANNRANCPWQRRQNLTRHRTGFANINYLDVNRVSYPLGQKG